VGNVFYFKSIAALEAEESNGKFQPLVQTREFDDVGKDSILQD
jgi:hypothetical protein